MCEVDHVCPDGWVEGSNSAHSDAHPYYERFLIGNETPLRGFSSRRQNGIHFVWLLFPASYKNLHEVNSLKIFYLIIFA